MVVQCKKCETKFRFDESLIDNEGVWLRCSHCKNVFYLDKPAGDEMRSASGGESGKKDLPVESDLNQALSEPSEPFIDRKEEDRLPSEGKSFKKVLAAQKQRELRMEDIGKDIGELNGDRLSERDDELLKAADEVQVHESVIEIKPAPSYGKQLVYLLIILLLGGVYLWFFTEMGNQAADLASSNLSMLIETISGTGQKGEDVGPAQVDLMDISQRFVMNGPLGIIRVVEGTAINQSSHPMTRIRVKGQLFGDGNVLLAEQEAYCGNLLNGDEVATLTEDQIKKELLNPQGSDVSNDRIIPKGMIPFMIIFPQEPPGVVKTYVVPVGAERLLP